jgi:glycosyltransferase involved in cell wall biosynthesis
MKKILWLTSWYPNTMEPFSGDFIKRQAEAVSIYMPLKILYVGKFDQNSIPVKAEYPDKNKFQNLEEHIIYYPSTTTIFSKFQSFFEFLNLHFKFIKQLGKRNELPDLVHVHVAMKSGLIALYIKWKYKIPYVLTEHWSGYYEMSKDSLFKKSYLNRYLTRLIIKNASLLLPVSDSLGNQIVQRWAPVPFQKIPNVVDVHLFYLSDVQPISPFRFIHISTLLYPKNPEGIIRVFAELLKLGFQAVLELVGPLNPSLIEFIQHSGLTPDQIHCTGEISYDQVAVELRKSSSLVMFSTYETSSCVILEALCTGVPVIATRVGGIPEVIQEHNGILISAGNENELLEAMKKMILNYHLYDRNSISQHAAQDFSFETIGQQILKVYDAILEKK